MPTIGQDAAAFANSLTVAAAQTLLKHNAFSYTATANQEVYEVGFWSRENAGGQLEIAVYDITSGIASASLIGAQIINAPAGGGTADFRSIASMTPVSLVAGNIYAVAVRAVSDAGIHQTYYGGGAESLSNLTGASSFAAAWTDNANSDDVISVFATTRSTTSPTLTSVDADDDVTNSQTGVVLVGTNFEASQGANGLVRFSPLDDSANAYTEDQTVTSWGSMSITISIVQGGLPFGSFFAFVRRNTASEWQLAGHVVTLSGSLGKVNLTLTSIDASGLAQNFTGLAVGDQIEYETTSSQGGAVTVSLDSSFEISYAGTVPDTDSFNCRAWDATDYTWTIFTVINIGSGSPNNIGSNSGLGLDLSLGL